MTASEESLDEYGARLLRLFGPPPANWVRTSDADHDVLVAGGGQAGLAVGFALRRAGIARATVIDAAEEGAKGVWRTLARMRRLRTPKAWQEPELGFPELSFRNWYERTQGEEAYERLDRIPTSTWAEYLDWVERTVQVPVRHRTRLVGVAPAGELLALRLEIAAADGSTRVVEETARKLILANGVEGTGGPARPPVFAGLPRHLAAHTGERIDFDALRGRRVAVLGAAASALDVVVAALEAGAGEVHLFTRRPELLVQGPEVAPLPALGGRENFHRRSDADRWRLKLAEARGGRLCTLESLERAAAFPGFFVHLSAPWQAAAAIGDRVRVHSADGVHEFDFAIAGTGYQYDPVTRPELAAIAPQIALWEDRYRPPADLADEHLARWPYLGPGYELLEKQPGQAPWLGRIHVFSAAGALSFGLPVGDAASLPTGVPRLVDAVGRDLFFEDLARPADPPAAAGPSPTYRSAYEHALWTPPRAILLDLAVGAPEADPSRVVDMAGAAEVAAAGERAGIAAVRILDELPGAAVLDPTVVAGHLAAGTATLGYVADVPTTYHAPYNVARRVLTLDRATGGRGGVALRLGEGDEVSDAVRPDPTAADPAERWGEFAAVLLRLWESFPAEALVGDQAAGVFMRDELLRPVAFDGRWYRVEGPLDGPSSPQGRPLSVVADVEALGTDVAAAADVVVVERGRSAGVEEALAEALERVGRARADVALLGRVTVDEVALADPRAFAAELAAWATADGLDGFDLVPAATEPDGSARELALATLATVVPLLAPRSGGTLREAVGLSPVAPRVTGRVEDVAGAAGAA